MDATGRLVVVELKRDTADRQVHLQAVTYAALVSRFDLDTLARAHHEFLAGRGEQLDVDVCRRRILDHVDGGEWLPDLVLRPRLVIIAASFPKVVTNTVVWLSEMNLDIDLIEVGLWRADGRLLAGCTRVYPTAEVKEFTLAPARSASLAVQGQEAERARAQKSVHVLVESGRLPDGTRLRLLPSHGTNEKAREAIDAWVGDDDSRAVATWQNDQRRPLRWDADGQAY